MAALAPAPAPAPGRFTLLIQSCKEWAKDLFTIPRDHTPRKLLTLLLYGAMLATFVICITVFILPEQELQEDSSTDDISAELFRTRKLDSSFVNFNCQSRHTVPLIDFYRGSIPDLTSNCNSSDWRANDLCIDTEDAAKSALTSIAFSGAILLVEELLDSINKTLNQVPDAVLKQAMLVDRRDFSKTADAQTDPAEKLATYTEWLAVFNKYYQDPSIFYNATTAFKKSFHTAELNYTAYYSRASVQICSWSKRAPRKVMGLLILNSASLLPVMTSFVALVYFVVYTQARGAVP